MGTGWRRNYYRYKEVFLNTYNVYKGRADVKMFLEVILSLVAITTFATLAIRPTILTIIELNKDIKAKEATIAQMDQKISDIKKAQSLYQVQLTKINTLKAIFPTSPKPEELVEKVQAAGSVAGVTMETLSAEKITLSPNAAEDTVSLFDFSLSATSSYDNLLALSERIEKLARAYRTDAISIASVTKDEITELSLRISGQAAYMGKDGQTN